MTPVLGDSGRPLQLSSCPICLGNRVHYSFSVRTIRVLQCADCNFSFSSGNNLSPVQSGVAAFDSLLQRHGSADAVQAQALRNLAPPSGQCWVVNWDERGDVSVQPNDLGPDSNADATGDKAGRVVISVGQLEAFANPLESLKALRRLLSSEDLVIFVFSDVQHVGAEVGSRQWERLIGERSAYLDSQTALKVLFRAGFRCRSVSRLRCEGTASAEVAIVAGPTPTQQPTISVVIPVFNEAATVATVIDSVLRIEFQGAMVELVVVESNSTDGSREIVQRYTNHPRVTTLFEAGPNGKGHATRFGLSHASGDLMLVQDADLEYDFEDYHALIEPILRGCEAFTLGSRHGGRNHWKLRRFGAPLLSKFYNIAHVLVTGYINLLFRSRLRDPQTMFKVCRRDCIEGLEFHGNYFDFDYELLLKVMRKGYEPLEIPVNYRSRSHAEGKKIRMWRDAPLGLWMITKLRLIPLRDFLQFGEPLR